MHVPDATATALWLGFPSTIYTLTSRQANPSGRTTLQAKVVLKKDVLLGECLEHRQQKSYFDTTKEVYGIKRNPNNKN